MELNSVSLLASLYDGSDQVGPAYVKLQAWVIDKVYLMPETLVILLENGDSLHARQVRLYDENKRPLCEISLPGRMTAQSSKCFLKHHRFKPDTHVPGGPGIFRVVFQPIPMFAGWTL